MKDSISSLIHFLSAHLIIFIYLIPIIVLIPMLRKLVSEYETEDAIVNQEHINTSHKSSVKETILYKIFIWIGIAGIVIVCIGFALFGYAVYLYNTLGP